MSLTNLLSSIATGNVTTNCAHVFAPAVVATINWTLVWAVFAAVVPIVIGVIGTVLKLYGDRPKISDEKVRELPVIKDIKEDITNTKNDFRTNINEAKTNINERIQEINENRETVRIETNDKIIELEGRINKTSEFLIDLKSTLGILVSEKEQACEKVENLQNSYNELCSKIDDFVQELTNFFN